MELNALTYRIYKFLISNGWENRGKYDSKFIYLFPSPIDGLPDEFELKLPISNKSKDFYMYSKNVLNLLVEIYPTNSKKISELINLNDKLKNRFTKQWIVPEVKSQIEKNSKFDIYIPHKTL